MSVYAVISIVTSVGALIAVGISVWMLRGQLEIMGSQTAQLQRTLELSAESSLDALFMLVTQAYLDHPELRCVFNEDETNGNSRALTQDATLRTGALA